MPETGWEMWERDRHFPVGLQWLEARSQELHYGLTVSRRGGRDQRTGLILCCFPTSIRRGLSGRAARA